jgi:galactose mutarotase-like enzyme
MLESIGSPEGKPELKIETFKTPEGNEISCCPERGGLITSIKLQGKEILYLDENTFRDKNVNVKGGIPVLFPNAGPIPEELKIKAPELANLKQHGFAREQNWKFVNTNNEFNMVLEANDESKKIFPYDFKLSLISQFKKNGSLTIIEQVENLEQHKEMPVSFGLHPYFRVPNELKGNIEFNFSQGKRVKDNFEQWANGKAVSVKNLGFGDLFEVKIPGLGKLVLDISTGYERVWFWSMPGKDFICIEPVLRDRGGIIEEPERIKPSHIFSPSFNIRLIPE